MPHQLEVLLKVLQASVLVALQLGLHGAEVHGLADDVQIVWHLGEPVGGKQGTGRERIHEKRKNI